MSVQQGTRTKIVSIDGRESEGEFEVASLSTGERAKRSVKRLAIFWGIALLFLPVPAVHFVAVPGFLLVGIFMAVKTWFATRIVRGGQGVCPVCKEQLKFGTLEYKEPLKLVCPHCRNHLRVRLPV